MKIILLIALLAIGGISAFRQRRTTGGEPISSEMAASYVSIKMDGRHTCGGALISNKIVLTMAGCVVDEAGKRLYKLSVETAASSDAHHSKIKRIALPGLKKTTMKVPRVTMAAAILSKKIRQSGRFKPVMQPQYDLEQLQSSMPGNPLVAELISINSEKLQMGEQKLNMERLQVKIVSSTMCPTSPDYFAGIHAPSFCGDGLRGGMDLGDVGAPLIHNDVLIGLVMNYKPGTTDSESFLDVYEYSAFISKVKSKSKDLYIIS